MADDTRTAELEVERLRAALLEIRTYSFSKSHNDPDEDVDEEWAPVDEIARIALGAEF